MRGNKGHDGLITAGYRSSYAAAVDLRRSAFARISKEEEDNQGEASKGDTREKGRNEVQRVMY